MNPATHESTPNGIEMCPNDDLKSNASDRSIDEERQGTLAVGGGKEGSPSITTGYRADMGADGACTALRKFSARVAVGKVSVGDCENKVVLEKRIAGGSFGEVYLGVTLKGRRVAAKVEPQDPGTAKYLLHEGNVYRTLQGGPGIPTVYWFGLYGLDYSVLVMDLLGPTLHDLHVECQGKFSLRTVLQLADQMLDILEHIHAQGYVHRDISPTNFMLGPPAAGAAAAAVATPAGGDVSGSGAPSLYLIDFGHAKRYNSGARLIPRRNSVQLPRAVVGTPRFISVHAHLGRDESPRDDLEALVYIWIYLLLGQLPWQGIEAANMQEKLRKIADCKMSTPVDVICDQIPEEFAVCLEYVRNVKMFEPINYAGVRSVLRNLAAKIDLEYDGRYDWIERRETAAAASENSLVDANMQNGLCIPQDGSQSDSIAS